MAKTISDLTERVLQKLFVVEGGAVPQAEDTAIVLDEFNSFIDGLFADGLTPTDEAATPVSLTEGTEYTTSDAFPLKDRHFEGVVCILAVNLASDFKADLDGSTVRKAMQGRQRIDAAFMPSMVASVDRALNRLPSSVLWPSST